MSKIIEVEVRGNLSAADYETLKKKLEAEAQLVERHDREMYLLRDYAGYTKDFVGRSTDIRLRNTDGRCEIMLKQKLGDAREEISLALSDTTLDNAKKIVKALGCKSAIEMHRVKEVYMLNGIEWSLVKAPPSDIVYWEAEISVDDVLKVDAAHARLIEEAAMLGVPVLDDEGTRDLIHRLDTEANREVEF
jgi:adenylate cyclase class IV